jgi:ADP-heptose:LPS heptosyltransferase
LITRLSAIGDCLLTLPLANALRAAFPRALIAWAVEPGPARLIAGHPAVDEFLIVPRSWLKSPRAARALRRDLRARRFDCVLDPQSLTKSSLLGWWGGVRQRIGFAAPRGRELAPWLNNQLISPRHAHLVDASLELLQPLGLDHPEVRFDLPLHEPSLAKMDRFVRESLLTLGFVVINCGASCAARLWPAEAFGRVARYLGEQHHLPSVVTWAGPSEAERAEQVVAKSGGHALRAPDTSLPELAALLHHARLLIASDTGPLHLAAALGTPCLGLYGPTRVEQSGPYGPQHTAIQSQAGPLRGRRRRWDDSAMRRISVEQVCVACTAHLRRLGQATRTRHHAA